MWKYCLLSSKLDFDSCYVHNRLTPLKFHKIFNKNTVKVSYSCMPNIKSIINAHNKKILSPNRQLEERTCNCTRKETCPMNQNCLISNIVYEATLTSNLPEYGERKYIGLCESTFKKRFSGHKTSFNHERYHNQTTLSTDWGLESERSRWNSKHRLACSPEIKSIHTRSRTLCALRSRKIRKCELPW